MAFKGITFAGQNVTPKNDGGLYNAHYGNGILWGCSMNISYDDLVIQSGEFIMGGRVVQVDGATNVDLSGRTLQTGYIQIIANIDLSQGEGTQFYTTFVESATTTFPTLTQDDINDNGTLYQMSLAVVQISGGNLTNIVSHLTKSLLYSDNGIVDFLPNRDNINIGGVSDYGVIRYFDQSAQTSPMGVAFDNTGAMPQMEMFAQGGRFVFRPNGQGDTTNQMYLDETGQLHGAFKYYTGTGSQSTATGNAVTTIKTITGMPTTSGIYLISCYMGANTSASTANSIYFYVYNGNNNLYTTTYYEAQTTRHHVRFVIPFIGTPSSDTWTLRVQSVLNLSTISADLVIVRFS